MADKVKVSVLETNGVDNFEGPTERLLEASIVDFDNTAAQLPGNPNDAQAAVEALKAIVDSHSERHEPDGDDPLSTAPAVTISTNGINSEGSANSFARSNHTHKSEVFFQSALFAGEIETTSTSDVLMTGLTLTPPAGTYLVSFDTSADRRNNNGEAYFSIYVGGTKQDASERLIKVSVDAAGRNHIIPVSISEYPVTVNGSQAIEIRWRRASGGGRARSRVARSLVVKRVD